MFTPKYGLYLLGYLPDEFRIPSEYVTQIRLARKIQEGIQLQRIAPADPHTHTPMRSRRLYNGYGPPPRGRSLNAYERARPTENGRDLYEGLNKQSTETISKPPLEKQPGQDLQPKDLAYIGSYNWIEATVPSIIVPGEFRCPATLSTTPPHSRESVDRA